MNHTPAAKLLDTFCDGLDATTDGRGWNAEHDAARKEIVRRCNAHEALVKAATDLLAYLPASHDGFQVKLEDALIEALQFAGADIKVTTGE